MYIILDVQKTGNFDSMWATKGCLEPDGQNFLFAQKKIPEKDRIEILLILVYGDTR